MDKFKGELFEVQGHELAEFQAVALQFGWGVSVIPVTKDTYKVTFFENDEVKK